MWLENFATCEIKANDLLTPFVTSAFISNDGSVKWNCGLDQSEWTFWKSLSSRPLFYLLINIYHFEIIDPAWS